MGGTEIGASLLIGVMLILRYFSRGKVSHRLQYALWLVVLVRLLLPISLGESSISVMNAVPDNNTGQRVINVLPIQRTPVAESTNVRVENNQIVSDANSFGYATLADDGAMVVRYAERMTVGEIAKAIWTIGAVIVGIWFAAVNIVFYPRLRKNRVPIKGLHGPLAVYGVEHISSPCLFGLWKPSIYLTEKALADEEGTNHVLAHELCHYGHGDHIWSMLRIVCLVIWWWNPLVWIAARCSQVDGELACDEGALKQLEPNQRLAYGKTLVDMIAVRVSANSVLCAATTMAAGKKGIKQRLHYIINEQKTVVSALVVVLVVVVATVGCTFSGAVVNAGGTIGVAESANEENAYRFVYEASEDTKVVRFYFEEYRDGEMIKRFGDIFIGTFPQTAKYMLILRTGADKNDRYMREAYVCFHSLA